MFNKNKLNEKKFFKCLMFYLQRVTFSYHIVVFVALTVQSKKYTEINNNINE
jgi:hypothetical protein